MDASMSSEFSDSPTFGAKNTLTTAITIDITTGTNETARSPRNINKAGSQVSIISLGPYPSQEETFCLLNLWWCGTSQYPYPYNWPPAEYLEETDESY